jgi:thiamine phosphate synthase YjbQ (UPF0047 family)
LGWDVGGGVELFEGDEEALFKVSDFALVAPTEVLIVKDGKLVMDDDQRVYFYEFDGPKQRRIIVYVTD